jgi:uncharacterized membrane protein YphA (DoxX/SURF4 family)
MSFSQNRSVTIRHDDDGDLLLFGMKRRQGRVGLAVFCLFLCLSLINSKEVPCQLAAAAFVPNG